MKNAASLIMIGVVHEGDFRIALPRIHYPSLKSLLKLVMLGTIFIASFHFTSQVYPMVNQLGREMMPLRGAWLDEAVSDRLSIRYDCPIAIRRVQIVALNKIRFDALFIGTKDYKLLVSSKAGSATLRNIGYQKGQLFEVDLDLKNVSFTKEYYKNSPIFQKNIAASTFMHKPLQVAHMKLNIKQGDHRTSIKINESKSKDIDIAGTMELKGSKVVQDKITVSFSPMMILRALLPKDQAG